MMSRKVTMILIGCAAVPAIRLYYVQEMIAALIMFSILFLVVSVVVFFLFLLDLAVGQIITWAELHIAPAGRLDDGCGRQRHGKASLGPHRAS